MENNRRIGVLSDFYDQFVRYVSGTTYGWASESPQETPEAREARSNMNRLLDEVSGIMRSVGVPPVLGWSPPPAIGGYSRNIDVIINVFRLHQYQIEPVEVADMLERAVGKYERNYQAALIRTFNPFFWVGCALRWIAGLPFAFLVHLGMPRQRIEGNAIGKMFKGIVELATGLGAIAATLKAVGLLNPLLAWIGISAR